MFTSLRTLGLFLVAAAAFAAVVLTGVHSGRGQRPDGPPTTYTIDTFAGTTSATEPTGTGIATQQPLTSPGSVAVDSQARVYIAAVDGVWVVESNGQISPLTLTDLFGRVLDISLSRGFTLPPPDPQGTLHLLFVSAERGNLWYRVYPEGIAFADRYPTGRAGFVAFATDVSVLIASGSGGQIFVPFTEGPGVPDAILAGRDGATGLSGNGCDLNEGGAAPLSCLKTAGRMFLDERPIPTPTPAGFSSRLDLYVADSGNHRIRRISSGGVVTTVAGGDGGDMAGDASQGFSGDGGPARLARLNSPSGVALDEAGDLFIADAGNLRVREVDTKGRIFTIAGNGGSGRGGDGGPARDASFCGLGGLAVDSDGNIYVADTCNNLVRVLHPEK